MIVALAGDWHGNLSHASGRLMSLGMRGQVKTVLHLGDFGIWPGPSGKRYLRDVETVCAKYDLDILVTPGNHEDWARFTQLWTNPKNQNADGTLRPLHLTEHIALLPRGHRWEMGGRTFVSLGGAPSVDFPNRTPGRDWWPEEAITQADVDRVVAGGYADVMLTHDSPDSPWQTPSVARAIERNDFGWTEAALAYAGEGRRLLTAAFLGVQPRLLVHGHYHCEGETRERLPDRDHDVRILSLAADHQAGNVRLLDLETLEDES